MLGATNSGSCRENVVGYSAYLTLLGIVKKIVGMVRDEEQVEVQAKLSLGGTELV